MRGGYQQQQQQQIAAHLEAFGCLEQCRQKMVVIFMIEQDNLQKFTLLTKVSHQPGILLTLHLVTIDTCGH